jgi:hypothetical protein
MLPSAIATLVCSALADHPALAFTCVQGAVKFSSPKNHARPVLFNDRSVNETGNGAVPERGEAVKLATGGIPAGFTVMDVPGSVVLDPPALATVSRAV